MMLVYNIEDKFYNKRLSKLNKEILNLTKSFDIYLAGGSLRTVFDKNDIIMDYDLFFKDKETPEKVISHLVDDRGCEIIFKCPIGLLTTLKGISGNKIQLITKNFYETPEYLLNTFDINACRHVIYKDKFYTTKESIKDVVTKTITLHTVTHHAATFRRLYKYQNKGYKLPQQTITKYLEFVKNSDTINTEFYID